MSKDTKTHLNRVIMHFVMKVILKALAPVWILCPCLETMLLVLIATYLV